MKSIDQYWYSQNPVVWLLLPLSWLFQLISVSRRWLYRLKILSAANLPVPVIIVGNIAVGGTGKTPLLIALCDLLQAAGYHPGVISRGYGSTLKTEALVTDSSSASDVGDEPLLIAQKTSCPVAVGKNRVAAARLLLMKHESCDLILSDDGLQHYALNRDLEVAVVDAKRLHGNGFYLPAGPLRESVERLTTVDLVAYNGTTAAGRYFNLMQTAACNLKTGEKRELMAFRGQTVHAVAGIGHPERFFNQLKAARLDIAEHAFADHHSYTESDLNFGDSHAILMTEKDAVKCGQIQQDHLWAVPVRCQLSPQLAQDFLHYVQLVCERRWGWSA